MILQPSVVVAGDILAGENVDPVSLGGLSAESREAVLERQRQIQLQKARERATGSAFPARTGLSSRRSRR